MEYLDEDAVGAQFPFTAPGAILADGDAQFDAFRFTHRLLEKAVGLGARIFDRTDIAEIEPRRGGVTLHSEKGHTVSAGRVIFATGYESQRYLKQNIGDLNSTFALVTEPIETMPAWPDCCLIWETARPYCYLRTTEDGRILIGGKDTPYATAHRQEGLVKAKTAQLVRRLQRLLPATEFDIAYAWAGTFGTTKDGLAYIGVSPEWPHAYFALGYGGNGITMSLIAAELMLDHYLGRENTDAGIFAFDR